MKVKVSVGSVRFGKKTYQVGDEFEGDEEAIAPLVAAGVVELVENVSLIPPVSSPPETPPKKRRKADEEVESA